MSTKQAKHDPKKVNAKFAALVKSTATGKLISFAQIHLAVRKHVPDNGWMYVRNLLQAFIDAGVLKRTNDVYHEDYEVLTTNFVIR